MISKATLQIFGHNKDGTMANAFQHAYWNALMVWELGAKKAELFAIAHEAWPEKKLNKKKWGYSYRQFTNMDR